VDVEPEPWDIVELPVPFTDKQGEKERPAVVLSTRSFNALGHVIVAKITSAKYDHWPSDVRIQAWEEAGLAHSCVVRMIIFTIDARRVLSVRGRLALDDREAVFAALQETVVSSPA
jgi:mRNA interferase MazF